MNDRDAQLAGYMEELLEARRHGRIATIPETLDPELAGELRSLWSLAQLTASDPSPEEILPREFGPYVLIKELGRGGMGVVYQARQRDPDRLVAIKMILHGDLARFRAESRMLARLEGLPHIVGIYEVGEAQGRPYFSMPYIEGCTLAQRLARNPLSIAESVRLLSTVARAVHAAHEAGILHRDLKPSNILLDARQVPFVTDFGLAKQVESSLDLTPSRAVIGTPSYLAPEQADSKRGAPTPASDVYSMGAILYELLTGKPPFRSDSYLDTIWMVLQQDPIPPRALSPTVDRALELICLKCLEKAPGDRYLSAAELADDLDAYSRGEATSAEPISLRYFIGRLLRDTHHAAVLRNWGGLWMAQAVKIFIVALITNVMKLSGIERHEPYLVFWALILIIWGIFFWSLRRRGGPVLQIERQMAHVWAAGVAGCLSMFIVEWLLNLPALTLTPGLAVVGGMVFVAKAGLLSGMFYMQAIVLFLSVLPIIAWPKYGQILYGLFSALCFGIPGYRYWSARRAEEKVAASTKL